MVDKNYTITLNAAVYESTDKLKDLLCCMEVLKKKATMGDNSASAIIADLQQGLTHITSTQRLCIELVYLQKYTQSDAADELMISQEAVWKNLKLGIQSLSKVLQSKKLWKVECNDNNGN